jgi:hypothetical protein
MTKSLFYRLFGIGKVPPQLAAQLNNEFTLILDEGSKGSVTHLDFRSPQRYANWKRQWFTGSILLTEARLVALRFSQIIVDVAYLDERIKQMNFSVDGAGELLISFDASLFRQDWSGRIEYRFQTAFSQAVLDRLQEKIG